MARRKSAYLMLFFALILMAHPAASRGPAKAIEYDASQLVTHRSGDYVSLEMVGLRPLADVGQPALPADVLQFVIPADAPRDRACERFPGRRLPHGFGGDGRARLRRLRKSSARRAAELIAERTRSEGARVANPLRLL